MARRIPDHFSRWDVRRLYSHRPSRRTRDTIRENASRSYERLSRRAREVSDRHTRRVRDSRAYNRTMRTARNLRSRFETYLDKIIQMLSITSIRDASPRNRRFVMANPEVLTKVRKGHFEGYRGLWEDKHPNRIGRTDPDYRNVTSGIAIKDKHGNTKATTYWRTVAERDSMTREDRAEVRLTWASIKTLVEITGKDPTSLYNLAIG